MPSCINCGGETKYNGGLCSKCYGEKNTESGKKTSEKNENHASGLTKKERDFRYNMIKGRIAETLIQELFLSMGYNVFRYGMENTIPGIMDLLKGIRTDVADDIRRMPDFVIQNPSTREVNFVEVKFRANEFFSLKDLSPNYPYTNSYFIIVSKKHIKCISYKELEEGMDISPTSRNYLGSRKEFDLEKEVIIDFCSFAVQIF